MKRNNVKEVRRVPKAKKTKTSENYARIAALRVENANPRIREVEDKPVLENVPKAEDAIDLDENVALENQNLPPMGVPVAVAVEEEEEEAAVVEEGEKDYIMEIDEEYEELYSANKYAKTHDGTQMYAVGRGGDQYYWEDEHRNQVYAKAYRHETDALEEYYAKDKSNKDLPAGKMTASGIRIFDYITTGNAGYQPYMATGDGDELAYIFNDGVPKFALDGFERAGGRPYYLKKFRDGDGEEIEVLPTNAAGKEFHIQLENGKVQVPFNLTGQKPLYPLDDEGDETYFRDRDGAEYYATHKNFPEREFYATNARSEEVPARDEGDRQYYARSGGGQTYPRDGSGGQRYIRFGKRDVPALDGNGEPYYAADEDRNEFYPFDEDEGEFYVRVGNVQTAARMEDDSGHYAKNASVDEFYPRRYFP